MSQLKEPLPNTNIRLIRIALLFVGIATILSIVALLRSGHGVSGSPGDHQESRLQRISRTGVLRVGYGGFPPYTIIDPKETDPNKRVKGFSVDLVNEIAQRQTPPLKVEWVLLNWDTLKADMLSNKFDFVADPVYQTVPRAMDFLCSEPYSYFGIAAAIVRKGDSRFRTFKDLDREDITIVLAEGWTSSEYARQVLSKPKFKSVPVTGDAFTQLDDVLLGRADVALNDVPTVVQYARAHPDRVQALWTDRPPSSVAGGFLMRREDSDLKAFLDVCVRLVVVDGTLKKIDDKWQSFGFLPEVGLSPGSGLSDSIVTKPNN